MTTRSAGLLALAVLVTATLAFAQPRRDDAPKDFWRAWAVTQGGETRLVVEGVYSNGGPGTVVTLRPNTPQGINPKVLMLDLKVGTLPGVWIAVAHPVPATHSVAPYRAGAYESVHVRYPDGRGVVIDKITDAGTGPAWR